jgi:hypothetical protein
MSRLPEFSFCKSYIVFCLVLVTLISCDHSKQGAKQHPPAVNPQSSKVKPEDEVVNLVMNLEEVKRKSAQVKNLSKGKRTLMTYVETPPTGKDSNYWVKVSEDNGESLVAYYTFAVDAKSLRISYYDDIHDTTISLDEWRKSVPVNAR